jgi:hypothetical protein
MPVKALALEISGGESKGEIAEEMIQALINAGYLRQEKSSE